MRTRRRLRDSLSGSSIFLREYEMEDGWYCRILRSTIVRGKVRNVLVDPEFISAGAYLIQRKDISGKADLEIFGESFPILSDSDIHYFGQPIALLIAPSVELLNVSEKMIQIRYEEFPALPEDLKDPQQLHHDINKTMGDPARMWEKSVESVESVYNLGSQSDVQHEGGGSLAHWTDGELKIITPTIWPHLIAESLHKAIGLPMEQLHIMPTNPGIYHDHLLIDGTLHALFAGIAAEVTGRNIMLYIGEDEQRLFGTKQPPIRVRMNMGLDADKQVLVNDLIVDINTGSYSLFTDEIVNQVMASAPGLYRAASWRLRIHLYRTNLPPMSIFHGFPVTLLQIPAEIQANRLAELSQESPLQWRSRQLLKSGEHAAPDFILKKGFDDGSILGALDSLSDFTRRHGACELLRKRRSLTDTNVLPLGIRPLKGVGMSFGFQPSGFSRSTEKLIKPRVRVRMETDGTVHAFVHTAPGTSATKVLLREIIQEELGVDEEKVVLHTNDSRELPDSGPVCLSRSRTIVMDLFRQACRKLQKQRFHNPLPLDVTNALRSPRKQDWDGETFTGDPFIYRSYGAIAMAVEVDPVTYIPEITNVWMVVDIQTRQDISQARSALEGGIVRCLDWVRGWHGNFRSGVLQYNTNSQFQYRENQTEPKISIRFLRSGDKSKSYQTGFRDLPYALVPGAYLSALSQATGGYFDNIPIDSQSMYQYLKPESDNENTD